MANARIRDYPLLSTMNRSTARIAVDPAAADPIAANDPVGRMDVDDFLAQALVADNVVTVSVTNGVDSTGARGTWAKPFKLLAAAQAAASSGDTIVVYPGSYTITATLGKNGVNWLLYPGVTITQSTADQSIFGDGGSALTYKVDGFGDLVLSGDGSSDSTDSGCLKVSHASSDISFRCRKMTVSRSNGLSNFSNGIIQANGTMRASVDFIDASGAGSYGLWWTNGKGYVEFREITAGSSAAGSIGGSVQATPTGDFFARGESAVGGTYGVNLVSNQTEAKMWVECLLIQSTSGGGGLTGVSCQGGKLYVTAQKIQNGAGGTDALYAPVTVTGGQCWVTAQKLTSNIGCGIGVTGGILRANVLQIEDLGSMGRAITNSGGTLELHGAQAVMAIGNGLVHSGGTTRLIGVRLDTSAQSAKNPVTVSAANAILDRCTLRPHASADSVTAGSAQTITNYGSVARTAKHSNVTVNVEALLVDSNVV